MASVTSSSMKYRGPEIYKIKAEEIRQLLAEPDVDLWRLREMALSEGGLVNDDLRRVAWPKLVGLHDRLFEERKSDAPDTKAAFVVAPRGRAPRDLPLAPGRPPTGAKSRGLTDHLEGSGGAGSGRRRKSLNGRLDDDNGTVSSTASSRDRILAMCDDFDQIERDVARCTWHLLTGTQRSVAMQMEHKRHKKIARLIRRKQRRLANLINLALQQSYPFLRGEQKLRYYQGFHDVACIVLSTLGGSTPVSVTRASAYTSLETMASSMGLDLPAAVLLQLSESHFADCMRADFLQLQTALRLTLFPLLALFDKQVHDFLYQAEMEPFFCLSWVITWFSHEIRDTELVKRLFDAFIVSHPLMPVYMSVAMIVHPHNRQEVLQAECDFSILHQTLQALPRNSSMVGWKYRPGDGYVSDDEGTTTDDDDEDSACSESMTTLDVDFSYISKNNSNNNKSRNNGAGNEDGTAATGLSMESSRMSSILGAPPVPFQELIDMSVGFMHRMPPSRIVSLAKRYYGGNDHVDVLLETAPDISLLKPAPAWSLAPTAKADWVLQQRAREARSQSTSTDRRSRRNEKKRSRSRSVSRNRRAVTSSLDGNNGDKKNETEQEEDTEESLTQRHLKDNSKSASVIVLGLGEWTDYERKKRRRRNLMLASAVAVAAVAILLGMRFGGERGSTKSTSAAADVQEVLEEVATVAAAAATTSDRFGQIRIDLDPGTNIEKEAPIPLPIPLPQKPKQKPKEPLPRKVSGSQKKPVPRKVPEAHEKKQKEPLPAKAPEPQKQEQKKPAPLPVEPEQSRQNQRQEELLQPKRYQQVETVMPVDFQCVCPDNTMTRETKESQPWVTKIVQGLDDVKKHVVKPILETSNRLVQKAGEELNDLPETRLKEFATILFKGAARNVNEFKQRHALLISNEQNPLRWREMASGWWQGAMRSMKEVNDRQRQLGITGSESAVSSSEWEDFGVAIRESFPSLETRLDQMSELLQLYLVTAVKGPDRLSKTLRERYDWEAVMAAVRDHIAKLEITMEEVVQPTLKQVPINSIRMVRQVCKERGSWHKLERVPIFC